MTDTSVIDENGNINADVFYKCYEDSVIKMYGSLKNYEDYLNSTNKFLDELDEEMRDSISG